MISTLKPYGAYRETGLSWVPICPSHWKKSRLKDWVSINRATLPEHTDEAFCFLYLDISSVDSGYLVSKPQRLSFGEAPSRARRIVSPGDTLISTVRTYLKAVLHVEWLEDGPIIASTGFAVLTPKDVTVPAYVGYVVQSEPFVNSVVASSIGVAYPAIAESVLGSLSVLIPPYDEQEAIVRFIRHLDHRVNRLIKTKRQLIALLNEQKQAIIHRAITQGLDPTAPLKPSGVDWIGTIPEHWKLKRFKYLTKIASGQVDPRVSPYREMVLIAPNHIQKATGKLLMEETADEQGADSGKYLVKAGEIVYSKIRPNLQKATIALRDCLCSADMYAIQPHPSEMEPEYLLALMLSRPFTQYVVDSSMRVAMPKVNRDALGNAWLWYPDVAEQHQILSSIRHEISSFDTSITQATREIDLIREYRTRLVADVVTGQLDVRHLDLPNVDEGSIGLIDESDDLADVPDDDLVEAVV